jgi:hypothetical protein
MSCIQQKHRLEAYDHNLHMHSHCDPRCRCSIKEINHEGNKIQISNGTEFIYTSKHSMTKKSNKVRISYISQKNMIKLTGILTCWAGTDQWVWSWTKMAMRSCKWLGCCRQTVCLLHKKHSGFRVWTKESQSNACSTYDVPDVEGHRSTLNCQHPVHQIQSCHQQSVLLLLNFTCTKIEDQRHSASRLLPARRQAR